MSQGRCAVELDVETLRVAFVVVALSMLALFSTVTLRAKRAEGTLSSTGYRPKS